MPGADQVIANLNSHNDRQKAAIRMLAERYAGLLEAWAKNPPYPLRPLRPGEKERVLHARIGGTSTKRSEVKRHFSESTDRFKWRTQTGHARQSLFGKVIEKGSKIHIRVAHGVQYGVYLELAMQGKYAVLRPAVNNHLNPFFEDIKKVVRG